MPRKRHKPFGRAPEGFKQRWLSALVEAETTEAEWAVDNGWKQQLINQVANSVTTSQDAFRQMLAFVEAQETRMRARLGAAPSPTA